MTNRLTHGALVIALLLASLSAPAATEAEKAVRNFLSQAYVTTVLLTDGQAIQLGLVNFNPNDFAELDDDNLGNDDTVSGREKLAVFGLPIEFEVPAANAQYDIHAGVRLSLLREVETGRLIGSSDLQEDRFETRVFDLEGSVRLRYHWDDQWKLDLGQSLHLMRYENHTDFRNADSRALQSDLDGVVTNFSSEAWLSQTTLGGAWVPAWGASQTELFTTLDYLAGDAVLPAESEHNAEPEAWYWRQGIRSKLPVFAHSGAAKHVILSLSRVNVGGDLRHPMGSSMFFEAGVGFISSTNGRVPLVRNLGLFLNLNYGSNLRGGTLGILYNVD